MAQANLDWYDVEESQWVDKREPFEKICVSANGGIDIDGEWEFSGTYSISVPRDTIGNIYTYQGRIYRGTKRYSRWRVRLEVCGGEYGRITLKLLQKTASSIREARKMVVKVIQEFEATNRYKEEMWNRIICPDNREPIIKEINGELVWVATTWNGIWSELKGRTNFGSFQNPFGCGDFYTRRPRFKTEYERKENGDIDWDRSRKVYEEPSYTHISVSLFGMSGGGSRAKELQEKIDQAIFDVTNESVVEEKKSFYRKFKKRM